MNPWLLERVNRKPVLSHHLGAPSPFFPGIRISFQEAIQKPRGDRQVLKTKMVEKKKGHQPLEKWAVCVLCALKNKTIHKGALVLETRRPHETLPQAPTSLFSACFFFLFCFSVLFILIEGLQKTVSCLLPRVEMPKPGPSRRLSASSALDPRSCACYYVLPELEAILAIGTPGLLFAHAVKKLEHVHRATLVGDYLYFQQRPDFFSGRVGSKGSPTYDGAWGGEGAHISLWAPSQPP